MLISLSIWIVPFSLIQDICMITTHLSFIVVANNMYWSTSKHPAIIDDWFSSLLNTHKASFYSLPHVVTDFYFNSLIITGFLQKQLELSTVCFGNVAILLSLKILTTLQLIKCMYMCIKIHNYQFVALPLSINPCICSVPTH